MNTKFTPGPWEARRHGVIVAGVVRQYANGSAQDQIFMANSVQDDNGGIEAQHGNTILAAAAPELLAALENAWRHHLDDLNDWLPQVREAIAKATGERT